ncbi:MAG: hypothetical protein QOJ66_130 [Ilumatobacteraceae bacterium]
MAGMRIITAQPDEIARLADLLRFCRGVDALVVGTKSIPVPTAMLGLVEAGYEALRDGGEAVIVGVDQDMSPADAAVLLGVTRQYVDRLVASGALPVSRVPGSRYRRIPARAVLAMRAGPLDVPDPVLERLDEQLPPVDSTPKRSNAATPRGRERRDRLIAATARLVAERGFHSVGITEIGAAAGVTGAAIYRHFPNKTQMLVAVFDQVVDELLDGSATIVNTDCDPDEMLNALVQHHVRLVLRNPAIFGVYSQESQNLPADDRTRLRRNQRTYVLRWSSVLRNACPGLDEDEARTRVQVTFGLINSIADFPSQLPAARLQSLLGSMASVALKMPN